MDHVCGAALSTNGVALRVCLFPEVLLARLPTRPFASAREMLREGGIAAELAAKTSTGAGLYVVLGRGRSVGRKIKGSKTKRRNAR